MEPAEDGPVRSAQRVDEPRLDPARERPRPVAPRIPKQKPQHRLLGGSPRRRCCGFCFGRSEEHTSELQSRLHLVCRLLLEKKKNKIHIYTLDLVITN